MSKFQKKIVFILNLRKNISMTKLKILHKLTHNIKNIERKTMLFFNEVQKNEKTLNIKKFVD